MAAAPKGAAVLVYGCRNFVRRVGLVRSRQRSVNHTFKPHRNAPLAAKHNHAVRAQSINPFRQCALAHCLLACRLGRRFCLRQRSPPETRALPQRALRALGTASLVAACGSIVFDATGALFDVVFVAPISDRLRRVRAPGRRNADATLPSPKAGREACLAQRVSRAHRLSGKANYIQCA